MIEYKSGDILAEDVEALVNTVNCVGVMGRGVALQFKRAFPGNFRAYADRCRRGEMRPGRVFVFETGEMLAPRYVVNFPTKRHWRGKSRLEDVESGLAALAAEIRARGIRSIAIPPLGCGLGGLHWPTVRARLEAALRDLPDVRIVVFEPGGQPAVDPAIGGVQLSRRARMAERDVAAEVLEGLQEARKHRIGKRALREIRTRENVEGSGEAVALAPERRGRSSTPRERRTKPRRPTHR